MRIISGEYRGRRLLPPRDDATRPVTDRVKQSVFDVVRGELAGAVVWDVFAGTGSFGLEALSRGADQAVFFERYRPALDRLRRNIDTLDVASRCRIETGDVYRPIPGEAAAGGFGVAFVDPPYAHLRDRPDDVCRLLDRLGGAGGLIVLRHDARDDPHVPASLAADDVRMYGRMAVRLLRPTPHHNSPAVSNTGPSVQESA